MFVIGFWRRDAFLVHDFMEQMGWIKQTLLDYRQMKKPEWDEYNTAYF